MLGVALGGTLAFFGPPPQLSSRAPDYATRWHQQVVVRITDLDPEDLRFARALALEDWGEHPPSRDLRIPRAALAELEARGIEHRLLVADLEARVAAETRRLDELDPPPSIFSPEFFDDFRDLDALEFGWYELAASYPARARLHEVGRSVEQRRIHALQLGDPEATASIVFIFGQHAREWISPTVGTCVAARLLEDPEASAALDALQVWIVPVANPDGYAYSWTEDRFWRRNRNPEGPVDLNRNWAEGWGREPGSSDDPESNVHRGIAPFSEPETLALRELAYELPELRAWIDVHSFSQLVLYPLSYLSEEVPSEQGRSRAWAEASAATLFGVEGVEYTPLRGSDLYPASGVAMDWGFANFDIPSLTYELRPDGEFDFPDGFILPPEEITGVCDEFYAATLELLVWSRDGGPAPVEPPPVNPPWPAETGEGEGSDDAGSDGDDASDDADTEADTSEEEDSDGASVGSEGGRPNGASDEVISGCACTSSTPGRSAGRLAFACLLMGAARRPFRRRRRDAR